MIHDPFFFWAVITSPIWLLPAAFILSLIFDLIDDGIGARVAGVFLFYWTISIFLVFILFLVYLALLGQDPSYMQAIWAFIWTGPIAITFWSCSAISIIFTVVTASDTDEIPSLAFSSFTILLVIATCGWILYLIFAAIGHVILA